MSNRRVVPPADPSSETVRQYLAANAQRELDALRTELDVRLSALEAALARPDSGTSLEKSMLALRRVAPAEAEAAAARATLEAQVHAQERATAAGSAAQRLLEEERATTTALRFDLEQARTALDIEQETAGRLQQESAGLRKSLEEERLAGGHPVRQPTPPKAALKPPPTPAPRPPP